MGIVWTAEQLAAINERPKKMLVSAAAGSGKTAVLTERIISELTDKQAPADISRFLIVTYTRAAASQLKSKISSAIQNAASADPKNKALARQLVKLGNAKISTIHSFCATIVKQNFERLSLSPSLRVCEAAQANELKENVMSELIELAYHGEIPEIPDFHTFADNFVTGNDSRLADTFLSLYEKVNMLPNGTALWENAAKELASDIPFMQTKYGEILSLTLERSLSFCKQVYAVAEEMLSRDSDIGEKYLPVLNDDLSVISSLEALLEDHSDISKISKFLSGVTYTRLPSVSKQKITEGALFFKQTAREAFKKEINELNKLFSYPVNTDSEADDTTINNSLFTDMRKKSALISGQTVAFLKEFDKRYRHEKRRLGLLDFSDLEQLTYKLLYDPDGSYSALSDVICQDFDEIFIDEFQDVNPIQSLIFNAISKKCRIFQVGDIKQSIYGFRGAAPDIFAECRRSYAQYTPNSSSADVASECDSSLTVFLSSNFRSAFPITEFVNRIFDVLFHTPSTYPNKNERIPYDASDRLLCGRSDTYEIKECSENDEHTQKRVPTDGYVPISIFLISQQQTDRSEKSDTEAMSSKEAEATVLANKIAELVSSGVPVGDIAVLYRNEAHARQLERALKAFGIPTSNDKGEELTNVPEVQLALSLLECVDDPHKDIPLAGALRSPIFRVTLDELIHIRKSLPLKNGSLYTALCKYTEETGFEKGKSFIKFTERIREFSQGQSAARVLWEIYNETDFFSLLYDGGTISETVASARRADLIRLHKLALESEASGRDGIYTFLKRLRTLAGTKDAPKAAASSSSNSVRFMTFHSSKGLEFEHCFVCGLGNPLSRSDSVSDLVTDDALGIATKLRDSTGIVKYDTPFRKALSERTRYRQYEEELRVLYVALTRAKTALYLSATISDADKLISECRASAISPEPFTFYRQSSRIKWIMTALYCEKNYVSPFSFDLLQIKRINMTADGYTEHSASENAPEFAEKSESPISPSAATPVLTQAQNTNFVSDSNADGAAVPRYSDPQQALSAERIRANLSYKYPFSEAVQLPAKVSVSKLHPSLLDETDSVSADELYASLSPTSDTSAVPSESDVYFENDISLYPLKEAPQDVYPIETLTIPNDAEEEKPRNQLKRPLFLTEPADTETLRQKLASELNGTTPSPIGLPPQYRVPTATNSADSQNAAEIGTATHLFMQFCDFDNVENAGIEAELARLCERSLILPYHAAIADKTALERFFASKLYRQMRKSTHLRREVRFNTRLSAAMFTSSPATAAALKDETLLVQGVIDCYFIDNDGKLILLDYKTDRFPPEMSERAIAAILKKRHSLQLTYYKTALERLMLRPVDKVLIFSFALGKEIAI